jgi:hypothetical protein
MARANRIVFLHRIVFLFCIVSAWAFAQDAVPAPVAPPNVDTLSLGDALGPLLQAASAGKVALAVTLGLIALTALLRHYGSKLPGKVGEALASPVASWVLPFVFSTLGALSSTLASGGTIGLNTLAGAIVLGLAGGGVLQKQLGAAAVAKAEMTGVQAATTIDSKAKALEILSKTK